MSIAVGVMAAEGTKCERCWHYSPSVALSGDSNYPGVCRSMFAMHCTRMNEYVLTLPLAYPSAAVLRLSS